MPQGYHEPKDPRTDKAPNHQQAASRPGNNISNAEIVPKQRKEVFNHTNVDAFMAELKAGLDFPYVKIYSSALGGIDQTSVLLTVVKDPKDTWANNILENSRYAKIYIDKYGVTEKHSGSKLKMRKFTGKNAKHIATKINDIKVVEFKPFF